jgi:DNA-binding transcriptional ArsR family regulator
MEAQAHRRLVNHLGGVLTCLKWCGYVEARREGRYVWYAVTDPRIRALVNLAHTIMADHTAALASCTRLTAEGPPLPQRQDDAV